MLRFTALAALACLATVGPASAQEGRAPEQSDCIDSKYTVYKGEQGQQYPGGRTPPGNAEGSYRQFTIMDLKQSVGYFTVSVLAGENLDYSQDYVVLRATTDNGGPVDYPFQEGLVIPVLEAKRLELIVARRDTAEPASIVLRFCPAKHWLK